MLSKINFGRIITTVITILCYLFLHIPIALIIFYSFSLDEKTLEFPPSGYTLKWFYVAYGREDIWNALYLSLNIAFISTLIALVLGTLSALAIYRHNFFGKETISFLVILPIALPGIVTGISMGSAISLLEIPFSTITIVIAHSTFCIVTVYNNALARLRRNSYSLIEASLDLGANPFQTFIYVILPNISTALLAGAMLSFALSFDEVIVTTFTAGQQQTIPIWMLSEFTRPRQRPVTNVVAVFVILATTLPILIAYYLTKEESEQNR